MSPRQFPSERRQYGLSTALSRLFRRRHLPLVGYLILAAGIGGAFAVDHDHFQAANKKIEHTLLENCDRGNRLRAVLEELVLQELPAINHAVKVGQLTPKEAVKARHQVRKDAKKVGPIKCSVVLRLK